MKRVGSYVIIPTLTCSGMAGKLSWYWLWKNPLVNKL
jgi:hypothetical protein